MKEQRGSELLSTARARGCWPCVKARVDEWARTERVGAAAHVEERVEEGVGVGWLTALGVSECECEGKASQFFTHVSCALERCGSQLEHVTICSSFFGSYS
jgi:hypothetical protein